VRTAAFTGEAQEHEVDHMRTFGKWLLIAAFVTGIAGAAHAADVMHTKTLGTYRVELYVLPAEPFFSKADVAAKNVKEGMEIEGGAAPVAPDADSHPNHHLIVHVFDKKSGKPIADATVKMSFVPLDANGKPGGAPVEVPVVVMQAVGKGPASTHYGNNVTMPAGRYDVTVTVNNKKAVLDVTAADMPAMPMGHMKM
jgi:5-hydroxyisourate hydrolase-like protein (transthyretin family)